VQPIYFVQHLADFTFGKRRWQVLGGFGAQLVEQFFGVGGWLIGHDGWLWWYD